jgi:hypothetical protein
MTKDHATQDEAHPTWLGIVEGVACPKCGGAIAMRVHLNGEAEGYCRTDGCLRLIPDCPRWRAT